MRYRFANQTYFTWLGLAAKSFIGRTVRDVVGDEIYKIVEIEMKKALAGEQASFEVDVPQPDGSIRAIEATYIPDFNDDGLVQGYFSITIDISERKRIENEAKLARSRLVNALENIYDAFIFYDADEKFILCNSKYREFYPACVDLLKPGTPMADIVRANVSGGILPDSNGHEEDQINDILKFYRAADGLRERQHVDGRWLLVGNHQTQDGEIVGVRTDITELKKREEELRHSGELFRNIFNYASTGMTIIGKDNLIQKVNTAFAQMLGYTPDALINMDIIDLTHPDERLQTIEARAKLFAMNENPPPVEKRYIHKNGDIVWGLLSRALPRDVDGTPLYTISQIQNITMRKEVEQSLHNEKERLRAILDNLVEGVVTIDERGIIEDFSGSSEGIFGYAPAEAIGQNVDMLMPSKYTGDHASYLAKYLRTGKSKVIGIGRDVEGLRKDGTVFPLALSVAELNLETGRRFVGTCRDMSAQKAAEKEKAALELELRQTQKLEAIGQLAAGIAHEINTPTQFIGDNLRYVEDTIEEITEVLAEYKKLADAVRQADQFGAELAAVDKIVDTVDVDDTLNEVGDATRQSLGGVERIARIVLAMKEFSHPGGSEKVTADINHAIKNSMLVCQNEWKLVADVKTDLDEKLPLVMCKIGELNQVFLNLIINSADAIKDVGDDQKGQINISSQQDGDWVEIIFKDTGAGIPEAIREKVFEPFFTTKEVGQGSGQGLAICHDIVVNKHRGKLKLKSEEGVGTTFTIRLPIVAESETLEIVDAH